MGEGGIEVKEQRGNENQKQMAQRAVFKGKERKQRSGGREEERTGRGRERERETVASKLSPKTKVSQLKCGVAKNSREWLQTAVDNGGGRTTLTLGPGMGSQLHHRW